ncbi:hypothetical protein RVR_9325 [Actinacidiphila reveromycinica]|uniref:Uncharacterized protein n=1 Tax=Actinacidiphila reveromycinica TaxID=659352 RepID=A0A7U3VSD4_9ACTN|nr:hypothetical protein [Streptomyces sp. SN-593]BBB01766.1 hypothetical protein RVR_9325 [Streptomyces sp. SN-593]
MSADTVVAVAALRTSGPARTWRISTSNGITAYGYLPAWAHEDPSTSDVDPGLLNVTLADVLHYFHFVDVTGPLAGPEYDADDPGYVPFFCSVECRPHAETAQDRDDGPLFPVLNVQITRDDTVTCQDPAELAALVARLRACTDYLDHHVRPAFTAIREDWDTRHRTPTEPAT